MQLISSSEIAGIAEHMRILMANMAPKIGEAYVMPELASSLDELRVAIRERLRIEKKPKDWHPEPRGLRALQWRIQERLYESCMKRTEMSAGAAPAKPAEEEIPWPDEPPDEDEPPY